MTSGVVGEEGPVFASAAGRLQRFYESKMKTLIGVLACAVVFGLVAKADPGGSVSAVDSNVATVFAAKLAKVLPEGWSVPSVRTNTSPREEGFYIDAENPSIKVDNPLTKARENARVALYFRPKSATNYCSQIMIEQSPYSTLLGSVDAYHVYGGSTGADLNRQIRKALELRHENKATEAPR